MIRMTLNQLAEQIRFHNNLQGFTVDAANIDQKLLLAVSEICEAQEELRDGRTLTEIYYSVHVDPTNNGLKKPEGFPVEIADAIIRLLDICHAVGIDIEAVITEKLEYNKSRPPKHGRQF